MKSAFSHNFRSILSLLAFAWALFVLFEFFRHCPPAWFSFRFSAPAMPTSVQTLLQNGMDLATIVITCLWLLSLMFWTGKKCLRFFGGVETDPVLTFCLEAGLGIFLWNLFWVGAGFTRLWFEPVWWGAAVLLTLAAVPDLLGAVRGLEGPKIHPPAWFVGLTVLYAGMALWNAMVPETFYDSLNYFLGVPQFWLFRHGIVDDPLQLLSGYFYGGSMYFMGGWTFARTEGASLFSVAAWGLCGVLAYGWTREMAGRKAAFIASAAVLTLPLLFLNAWAARVDGLFAFVSLLFVYALTRLLRDPSPAQRRRWILLAAVFSGLAVAIKPTALVVIAASLAVLALRRDKGWRERWIPLFLWSCLLGLLSAGPWLLKNWVFAGNPFFPYAFSWMGGRSIWAHGYVRLLKENQQFLAMDQGLRSWITLPWRLVMPGEGDRQIIGPLTLAFLPGLFIFKLKDTQRFLLWLVLACFVLGLTLSHMLRFSMPAFILSLILISTVLSADEAPAYWNRSWKVAVWAFALFFTGAYAVISAQYYQGWGRWTGQESREAYLERMIPNSYEAVNLWIDQNLPAQARLLVVGDARGLYYRRDFLANTVFNEPFLARAARQEKDAAGILRLLKEQGIDAIVVNGPEGLRLSEDYGQYDLDKGRWAELNGLAAQGLRLVYWKNFQAVYLVKDRLTAEKQQTPPDLFSFLSPRAYDFFQALHVGDKVKARQALAALIDLFPGEPYWREQLRNLN